MQFSVSLYSFYPAIQRGEIAPVDCIAKAKELGFEAVEAVDFVNFGDCATQEERLQRAKELRAAADAAGCPSPPWPWRRTCSTAAAATPPRRSSG